ncbi:methyltransferase family protein [Xenococcus sp. PCC 7305]|uniref:class I SAM-dependent DNA methyltransferase n=1 Tax=Xenococcus sp. PCC 7305 TaxID=102125 RepID=UPI0002AC0E43|nr:class I SAM-dependent methyltransferase [Xenococcus sp. PCC 7305]ELS00895.1 methyltransferase family protein [Xenococcus sp. PCC 7305]
MSATDKVQWVYSSQNNQELTERYDVWAQDYEKDLDDQFGYIGPEQAVDVLVKYVPTDARILDAGAGTGLVGEFLAQRGFQNIEAMDMSPGMLQQAEQKNVYKALHQGTLGEQLDFSTAFFDSVISVGVFTYGHVGSDAFDELIRITKPGGYIVFTVSVGHYQNSNFESKLTALESAGKWKKVEATEPFLCHLKKETGVQLQVWIYQIG